MKKFALLAVVILFTSIANAAKAPSFIKNVASKSIVLNVNHWKNSDITVSIKDRSGNTVYSEKLENAQTNRKYDLSKMEDGEFIVVVEDKQKLAFQKLNIENDQLVVGSSIEEIYKPVFSFKDDIWVVQALTLEKNAEISIADNEGNIVFKEKIEKPVVERKYSVKKLPRGNYEMVYSVGDEMFTHTAFKK